MAYDDFISALTRQAGLAKSLIDDSMNDWVPESVFRRELKIIDKQEDAARCHCHRCIFICKGSFRGQVIQLCGSNLGNGDELAIAICTADDRRDDQFQFIPVVQTWTGIKVPCRITSKYRISTSPFPHEASVDHGENAGAFHQQQR